MNFFWQCCSYQDAPLFLFSHKNKGQKHQHNWACSWTVFELPRKPLIFRVSSSFSSSVPSGILPLIYTAPQTFLNPKRHINQQEWKLALHLLFPVQRLLAADKMGVFYQPPGSRVAATIFGEDDEVETLCNNSGFVVMGMKNSRIWDVPNKPKTGRHDMGGRLKSCWTRRGFCFSQKNKHLVMI